MEVIQLNHQQFNINEPICSAIGFFDGLHIGHMALVDEVIKVGNEKNYKKALMTFDHHPLYVLGYLKEERYLTTMEDRKKILEEKGIDYLFVIEFTKEVASLSPQDFINKYLVSLSIQHIVCGFDFHFGDKNSGGIADFQNCKDLDVSVIDEVIYKNEKISSTRIRHILNEGYIDEMTSLLGRHYCISGRVIQGKQIGRTIGFPTANVDYQSYFLPRNGVYAVKVYIQDQSYLGMCNIGFNPTFKALDKPSLEINILDFNQDIYDETIIVEFYSLMRKEKAFSSKEELIQQLTIDQNYVREYFMTQV